MACPVVARARSVHGSPLDPKFGSAAISIYKKALDSREASSKVIRCYAELGDIEEVRLAAVLVLSRTSPPATRPTNIWCATQLPRVDAERLSHTFVRYVMPVTCKSTVSGHPTAAVVQVCLLCHEATPKANVDWPALLSSICALPGGAQRAIELDEKLRAMPPPEPPPPAGDELAWMAYNMKPQCPAAPSHAEVVTIFLDHGCLQPATRIALDAISDDKSGISADSIDAALQTRLLVENLKADAGIGEALLESESFAEFNRQAVARCCEPSERLVRHALKLYTSPADVARVLARDAIGDEAACTRVRAMSADDGRATIAALLKQGRGSGKSLAKVHPVAAPSWPPGGSLLATRLLPPGHQAAPSWPPATGPALRRWTSG